MGRQLSGVVLLLIAVAIGIAFFTGNLQKFITDATSALKNASPARPAPFPGAFRTDASRAAARVN